MKILLAAGAKPDGVDRQQSTPPLSDAAYAGQVEPIKILLAAGASIELQGWHGSRPLHWAVQGGHAEAVEMLLARGAAVERRQKCCFCGHNTRVINGKNRKKEPENWAPKSAEKRQELRCNPQNRCSMTPPSKG